MDQARSSSGSRNQSLYQRAGSSGGGSQENTGNVNNGANETSELDTSQEEIRGLCCQICYQSFSREGEHVPRNLQCGHTYCSSCLNRLVGQYCIGTVRCPTCKYETLINGFMDDVNQLPKNFGILEILAGAEDDSQRRRNPAMPKRAPPKPPTGEQSFSNNGQGAVGGPSRNASAFGSNESMMGAHGFSIYERRCPNHEGELMKVFCKSCSELICIYCQVYGAHANHCCELVSQTAEAGRREVISMSENLGRSKENLLLSRQIIIETISAVRHKEEKTIREVTHHFDTMRKRVHKRECQLKDMVKCKTSQKIAALEAQERTISDLIDRCELTQRICTRSLTEDDVTVVEEKDALLQEMTALTDISSDCELAPVCLDNILCHLPRDAFDVIMIHGTVEEAEHPQDASSFMDATSSGAADRNWMEQDFDGFNSGPLRNEVGAGDSVRSFRREVNSRPSESNQRGASVSDERLFPVVPLDPRPTSPGRSGRVQRHRSSSHRNRSGNRELNASLSSSDMDQMRSSLEEAIRAVQNQQMEVLRAESLMRPEPAATNISPQSAREAAAQAAIKRYQCQQQLVQECLSAIQQEQSQAQRSEDAQLTNNLSTIQSAMQEIQTAVVNARATLEESLIEGAASHNPAGNQSSCGETSSTAQQSSPDSGSFEARRPCIQSEDEDVEGAIYEQVSDGECVVAAPSSQTSIGQVAQLDGLQQHPLSELQNHSSADCNGNPAQSPVYHVYDTSGAVFHTVNSDSSDDNREALPDPQDMYDGPYYSCDCGNESVSCSCSECNTADEDDCEPCFLPRQSKRTGAGSSNQNMNPFFAGIPSHLDLNSSLESQGSHNVRSCVNVQKLKGHARSSAGQSNSNFAHLHDSVRPQVEDIPGTMTKLLSRMNLMKSKRNPAVRKKHHHKSAVAGQQPGSTRGGEASSSHMGNGPCAPFFMPPPGRGYNDAQTSASSSAVSSHGTRSKVASASSQKPKSSKKGKIVSGKRKSDGRNEAVTYPRGGSAESLLQNGVSRSTVPSSESHHSLSRQQQQQQPVLANSLPKCGNYAHGSCLSGEPALFLCSYCLKKYCHICAVHAAGKKCPKKSSKTHAIVALDDDNLEDVDGANASLNVPKNPETVNHKFMIKCTSCGDIKEFKVNSKTCSECKCELQVDLNLYNPCPNCDLLNSKDAIACELCSSDIIPIN